MAILRMNRLMFRIAIGLMAGYWASVLPAFAEDEIAWRPIDPDNLAVINVDEGPVYIELNPDFAPETVRQFKRLVRDGFYDGLSFYRVIDGFVAQGGDGSDMGNANAEPTIKAEFERALSTSQQFATVQKPDMFAPETGFVEGFSAARDTEDGRIWLTHCPGTVAMARQNEPGTSSTDFYIVIGQAPRYLDRNMNVFGRVVLGMEVVQRIRRGAATEGGMLGEDDSRSKIISTKLASDVAADQRPAIEVMDTGSAGFAAMLDSRRHRDHAFFHHKPAPVLDVCQVPNTGRLIAQLKTPGVR